MGRFLARSVEALMKVFLVFVALMWLLSGAVAAFLSFGPTLVRMILFGPISLANWL